MMYSKGDTIKLKDGVLVLVLKDGMTNEEFFWKHWNTTICEIYFSCTLVHWRIGIDDPNGKPRHVWYPVLMGDIKGWYRLHGIQ